MVFGQINDEINLMTSIAKLNTECDSFRHEVRHVCAPLLDVLEVHSQLLNDQHLMSTFRVDRDKKMALGLIFKFSQNIFINSKWLEMDSRVKSYLPKPIKKR